MNETHFSPIITLSKLVAKIATFLETIGVLGDLAIQSEFVFTCHLQRLTAASSLTFAATMTAAVANCTAVAIREQSAETLPIQQFQPSFLPT